MTGAIIKTFRLPRKLTIAWSHLLLSDCAEAISHPGPVTFDLENVTWVEPFGLTVISVALMKCLRQGKKVFYSPPADKKLDAYLSRIGFQQLFLSGAQARHTATSIELKHLESPSHGYGFAVTDLIARNMRFNRTAGLEMSTQINELMTNVFDHSRSPVGCFVCAQFYPAIRLVRFAFADGGIGIFKSLANSGKFPQIATDASAIRHAMLPGVTTRSGPAGGLGLDFVKRYTRANNGTLSIVSGRGKVNFYPNKIEEKHEEAGFDGTIVEIKILTNSLSNPGKESENDLF